MNLNPLGSIEAMCNQPLQGIDFIWVGDQSSLDIYKQCGGAMIRTENIYNSPLVFYSWSSIVDALVGAGVAHKNGAVYTIDSIAMIALIDQGRTWGSIGLTGFNGKIQIHTTDPSKSNSGFLFAGLLANCLNGGDVVDNQSVTPLLPRLAKFFPGYMPVTSATFFDQFMTQGPGAIPIAVGYESQLLGYLIQNPSALSIVSAQVRMLYPEPTVWASNPFIARTDSGVLLLKALTDRDIQRLAWEHHGNRPGIPGINTSATPVPLPWFLTTITSVVNMPASDVMERILQAISSPPIPATATPLAPATPVPSLANDSG